MANETSPMLILQDLVMPDIDGLTMISAFRTNPRTANTPVAVLSGNDDVVTRAQALAAGAADNIVKLPPKSELIACIHSPAHHCDHEQRHAEPIAISVWRPAWTTTSPSRSRSKRCEIRSRAGDHVRSEEHTSEL